jgi:hypothetical protein
MARGQKDIPAESMESWMGAPLDTKRWAADAFDAARDSLERADFNPADLDVFVSLDRLRGPTWQRCTHALDMIANGSLVLCRSARGSQITPMFIARCSGHRLTHQAAVKASDRKRLRWGASLLTGYRLRITLQEGGTYVQFKILRTLPLEETRLLRALGTIQRFADGGACFRVERKFLPVIRVHLARLGIDL